MSGWYTGRDPNKAFKLQYDLARELFVRHAETSEKQAFIAAESFLVEAHERKIALVEKMGPKESPSFDFVLIRIPQGPNGERGFVNFPIGRRR